MIVCSCNVLSENDVRACLDPGPRFPRTPAQVYQCLGCGPNCGRCARTLRSIITDALGSATAECERADSSRVLAHTQEAGGGWSGRVSQEGAGALSLDIPRSW
jgi:bacterioferritin-associated ferredoxin